MSLARLAAGALLAAGVCVAAAPAEAQSLLLDRGQRASGLWCFPVVDTPHEWRYLPGEAKLARDARRDPEFSFIRYVKVGAPAGEGTGSSTITEAEGGGVLHLLVLYETDPAQVERAQAELRRRLDDDELRLSGPVVFKEGRYAVISSILPAEGAEGAGAAGAKRQVLRTGAAPVLEGNRVALSFDLDKTQAALLNQSFRMTNPDVSVSFDMEFSGLTDPYDATLEVDWSLVQKSEKINAGLNVYFVSADVKLALEELQRNGAIKVSSRGASATQEGMLDAAYAKAVDLLFDPVRDTSEPAQAAGGLLGLLGASGGGATSYFSVHGGYELKDLRTSGKTVISLNSMAAASRHTLLTVNVGELYSRYGSNPGFFRTANLLEDPVFQQRHVLVSVDGSLIPEFARLVNAVTVTLRKTHQDGTVTQGETVLTRATVGKLVDESARGNLAMTYGYAGDTDREAWLRYDYRTRWSFQGGATYDTPWTATDRPMISVFAPYHRRTIEVVGTPDELRRRGVTHAVVRVSYPFFGAERVEQATYRVGSAPIDGRLEVTLPANEYTTRTSVSWFVTGQPAIVQARDDSSGLVFLDDIPIGGTP